MFVSNNSSTARTYFENKQRQFGVYKVIDVNKKEQRVMLERCVDKMIVGPLALNRVERLDPQRVNEAIEADEALGIVGWRGVTDTSLLLKSEKESVNVNIAKMSAADKKKAEEIAAAKAVDEQRRVNKARLDAEAEQRRQQALLVAAEKKAAAEQLQKQRSEVRVKPSAEPVASMFTTYHGRIFRVDKADIEGNAASDGWIFKGNAAHAKLSKAFIAKQQAQQAAERTARQRQFTSKLLKKAYRPLARRR